MSSSDYIRLLPHVSQWIYVGSKQKDNALCRIWCLMASHPLWIGWQPALAEQQNCDAASWSPTLPCQTIYHPVQCMVRRLLGLVYLIVFLIQKPNPCQLSCLLPLGELVNLFPGSSHHDLDLKPNFCLSFQISRSNHYQCNCPNPPQ